MFKMKKALALTLSLALAACFALTGCNNGGGSDAGNEPAAASSAPTSVAASEPAEASSEAPAGEGTLADFVEDMQATVDTMGEAYGDSVKIEMTAEGENILHMNYTLVDDSLGLTPESVQASMETQEEAMGQIVSLMEVGGIESPVVVVKWLNPDGSELFSQEYK